MRGGGGGGGGGEKPPVWTVYHRDETETRRIFRHRGNRVTNGRHYERERERERERIGDNRALFGRLSLTCVIS